MTLLESAYAEPPRYLCHNDTCPLNIEAQKIVDLGANVGIGLRFVWWGIKAAAFIGIVALIARWATS